MSDLEKMYCARCGEETDALFATEESESTADWECASCRVAYLTGILADRDSRIKELETELNQMEDGFADQNQRLGKEVEANADLLDRIAALESLLREIVEHPHCTISHNQCMSFDNTYALIKDNQSFTEIAIGRAIGHRCAAALAAKAFPPEQEKK